MRLRIVDYVANLGGGVRFCEQTIRALVPGRNLAVELVSHGDELRRYEDLLRSVDHVSFLDIPPANLPTFRGFSGFRGANRLNRLLRLGKMDFHYDVPKHALADCDLVWFPWIHRHRIPRHPGAKVIASLHDLIFLHLPELVPRWGRVSEQGTIGSWLASDSKIVASSHATVSALVKIFKCEPGRLHVIPLSGRHVREGETTRNTPPAVGRSGYLLYPGNTTAHKNHEVLFAGVAAAGIDRPLVLTGGETDFWTSPALRAGALRRSATHAGLTWGRSLVGLGYVDDATYFDLLEGAWAVVMPSLAEGGGSFPVLEAMLRGVPTVVSDIPVMREMVERVGGSVLWFDPRDPNALAAQLRELERNYPRYKKSAVEQIPTIRIRSWADVASDYAELMGL
jgi:glycosyltransferase involved in cell wall biosynthesis